MEQQFQLFGLIDETFPLLLLFIYFRRFLAIFNTLLSPMVSVNLPTHHSFDIKYYINYSEAILNFAVSVTLIVISPTNV
jgi:hypothetical protein